MRRLLVIAVAALPLGVIAADKKGDTVELDGMKAAVPAAWKPEPPSNSMRMAQYKLPKAAGDKADAELAIFVFPGGSGTAKQNLDRQLAKFVAEGRKEKSEKIKIGHDEGMYQDVSGTYKKKPFPMAQKFTPIENYRQLYVVFEGKDGKQYYMTLLGPRKTVEQHKKEFENWLKSFK
jgi:hypothetical protein